MNKFIEKLIGRLKELYARNDKTKKMAYEEQDWEKFDLFTHRCEGIYSAISIVNQLAEEYKDKNFIVDFLQYVRDNADNPDYDNDNGWSLADLIDLSVKFCNIQECNNGWIPCSERLPEVSGEYYTYVYYDGHYMYSIDEIDCDAIVKEWNCSSDYKIIAWKPIAPYQPKGE